MAVHVVISASSSDCREAVLVDVRIAAHADLVGQQSLLATVAAMYNWNFVLTLPK